MNFDHRNPRLRRGFAFVALAAVLGLSAVGLTQMRNSAKAIKLAMAIQPMIANQDLARGLMRPNEIELSRRWRQRALRSLYPS